MKVNYLFPNQCKRIGWILLVPSVIFGMFTLIVNYEPEVFNLNVPALFVDKIFGEKHFFGFIINNVLNEILGILIIIGALLVAFSKEKTEDEYLSKIRLESLVWAVYVNYAVLLVAFVVVYDLSFLWVMIFNMFTILLFFIVRFNWQISRLKKSDDHEK